MSNHGTRSQYVLGCRCPACRNANAAYRKTARERAAAGDTADLRSQRADTVDATAARKHLEGLKAEGFAMSSVASALEGDLSYYTILKVQRGELMRIAKTTEALILSVGVDHE